MVAFGCRLRRPSSCLFPPNVHLHFFSIDFFVSTPSEFSSSICFFFDCFAFSSFNSLHHLSRPFMFPPCAFSASLHAMNFSFFAVGFPSQALSQNYSRRNLPHFPVPSWCARVRVCVLPFFPLFFVARREMWHVMSCNTLRFVLRSPSFRFPFSIHYYACSISQHLSSSLHRFPRCSHFLSKSFSCQHTFPRHAVTHPLFVPTCSFSLPASLLLQVAEKKKKKNAA